MSRYSSPKIFWRILTLTFFLYSTETLYAQTLITGMEYVTINDDAAIYIQNGKTEDDREIEKIAREKCNTENETTLYTKEKLVKHQIKIAKSSKNKSRTIDNTSDYQEIEIYNSPFDNDSSVSISSGKLFLACSVDLQWRAAGIVEKSYFILYNVREVFRILWNNGISFPDNTSSCHSGRAPPSC